jgi:peptide/nickel transport system permease protein
VVWKHALKNAAIPIVTIVGIELGTLLGGSVITETIFAWPGVGRLLLESITMLDRPVIVTYLMATVLFYVAMNFIVDVIYAALDPRVRIAGDER